MSVFSPKYIFILPKSKFIRTLPTHLCAHSFPIGFCRKNAVESPSPYNLYRVRRHHAIIIITTKHKRNTKEDRGKCRDRKWRAFASSSTPWAVVRFSPRAAAALYFPSLPSQPHLLALLLSCALHAFTAGRRSPVVVVAVDVSGIIVLYTPTIHQRWWE